MKTYTRDVSGFDHPFYVNRDETSQGVVTNARVAQLVEHNLAKVGVAGSNPVSRSITNHLENFYKHHQLIYC